MDTSKCPACKADLPNGAEKCSHCGEWVPWSKHKREKTSTWNIIFVVFGYLFIYPIGLILNLIFILTGPGRMTQIFLFLIFLIIPAAALATLIAYEAQWPPVHDFLQPYIEKLNRI